MGGHGGLNILPQKRWNVYNWDNRERVRRDEEAAAKQQQQQREKEQQEQSEARLAKLRGIPAGPAVQQRSEADPADALVSQATEAAAAAAEEDPKAEDSRVINQHNLEALFGASVREERKKERWQERESKAKKKRKEERPSAEDKDNEKYRLGYGSSKGKQPWYVSCTSSLLPLEDDQVQQQQQQDRKRHRHSKGEGNTTSSNSTKRKSIEELRAERMERENKERKKAHILLVGESPQSSRYNSGYGHRA